MIKFKEMFTEKAKEMSDKEYEKYFKAMLKKYKVNDPSELDKNKRKKFIDEIESNVKADNEQEIKK